MFQTSEFSYIPHTYVNPASPMAAGSGPSSADGRFVARTSKAYAAILRQINDVYGPLEGAKYRDVWGVKSADQVSGGKVPESAKDGYVYRQYANGDVFIQQSPRATTRTPVSAPTDPDLEAYKPQPIGDPTKPEGVEWKSIAMVALPVMGLTTVMALALAWRK